MNIPSCEMRGLSRAFGSVLRSAGSEINELRPFGSRPTAWSSADVLHQAILESCQPLGSEPQQGLKVEEQIPSELHALLNNGNPQARFEALISDGRHQRNHDDLASALQSLKAWSPFGTSCIVGRELLQPDMATAVAELAQSQERDAAEVLKSALLFSSSLPLPGVPLPATRPEPLEDPTSPVRAPGAVTVPEGEGSGGLQCHTKRTYQPSVIIRKRRHGFLSRVRTKDGRRVIERRKRRGRRVITA